MFQIDAHELADVATEYLAIADTIPQQMAAELQVIQPQVEYAGVAEIKAVTPGSQGPTSLGGSTIAESVTEGLSLATVIEQTKIIHSRRQSADIPLADIIIGGIKNPVTITPIAKDGTLAFLWPGGPQGEGMHFYKHVQQARTPANPYPDRATGPITLALDIIAARYGDAVASSLLEVA